MRSEERSRGATVPALGGGFLLPRLCFITQGKQCASWLNESRLVMNERCSTRVEYFLRFLPMKIGAFARSPTSRTETPVIRYSRNYWIPRAAKRRKQMSSLPCTARRSKLNSFVFRSCEGPQGHPRDRRTRRADGRRLHSRKNATILFPADCCDFLLILIKTPRYVELRTTERRPRKLHLFLVRGELDQLSVDERAPVSPDRCWCSRFAEL